MNKPTSHATSKAYDLYSICGAWKRERGNLSNRAMRTRRAWKRMSTRAERREGRVDVASELEQYRCVGCGSLRCEDFWCETYTPAQRAAREAEDEVYLSNMYERWDDFEPCDRCDRYACICSNEPEPFDSDPYGDAYDDTDYRDFYD
jgi:hypothetical protein